ncbi:MAG TPA: prolipoprotein diacylglyceryl transferase, partial [Bacillales bacterium]|nr:prolipoprotein diacylglyceryl transferase [Bacillales bacterium]
MEPPVQPPIDRVAIHIGSLHIYWYGIIIAFGAFLGLLLAVRESRRLGYPKDTIVDFILFAVPVAIIFARAYYVLFKWGYYSEHPGEIIAIWHGGIAIHGALIGGGLTAIIFTKIRGYSFWRFVDILAPSVILGQAVGRWGNFVNQEAHGHTVSRTFLENLHLPNWIIDQMYINGAYYAPTF